MQSVVYLCDWLMTGGPDDVSELPDLVRAHRGSLYSQYRQCCNWLMTGGPDDVTELLMSVQLCLWCTLCLRLVDDRWTR